MGNKETFHGYGPEQGYDFLREGIRGYYAQKGVALEAGEVFISDGAKSDLGNILDLFDRDNIVLVPDPVYPVYVDTNCLLYTSLLHPERMAQRLKGILEWKNLTIEKVYGGQAAALQKMLDWLKKYGEPLKSYICDTGLFLDEAAQAGKNIMFEAQLGTLRDIDFGIYPYTSSSSTIAAYAPVGAGIPNRKLDKTIGIMKAYSTCVGEGPFTAEMFGDEAEALRKAGGEYGAATGRPRRVGGFDVVASRYGVRMQGADELALTKMDVLSYLERIPVCTAYRVDGELTQAFPFTDALDEAQPVIEYLEGWGCDISGCRSKEELPAQALAYIAYIEAAVGCKVRYVSVGPAREQYVVL